MDRWRATALDMASSSDLLIQRFSNFANLSEEERAFLQSLDENTEEVAAGTELVSEGQSLDSPRLLTSGWACRYRMLPDGRRQIFEFILPGDLYGLCHRPQALALTAAMALTPAVVADATGLSDAVIHNADKYPGLAAACYATASMEEAYLLNQLMRVGRQTAYERTAHLILELQARLNLVGIADEISVPVPLTQEILADALGLSVVHLNRTLQQLRRRQLIEFKGGVVRILRPEELAHIADFRAPRISHVQRAAAA